MPVLCAFSLRCGGSYLYTVNFKLQLTMLTKLGDMAQWVRCSSVELSDVAQQMRCSSVELWDVDLWSCHLILSGLFGDMAHWVKCSSVELSDFMGLVRRKIGTLGEM